VIGFGGRVLDAGEPKYLNTSDTPLFYKSRIIYGLDLAYQAIRRAQKVVIVEGYMDVIAAHQHGFDNVVACMGTSLTTDQLRQLQRYTPNFVLALDADAAGQQATIRGLNQARQALDRVAKPTVTAGGIHMEERLGANLFICAMPEGEDPDDVIRQQPDRWQQLVDNAQPLVDFYFDVVARQYDLTGVRGKGQAVAELAPLIAELKDEIEQKHYVDQLSRWVRIDEQTIWERGSRQRPLVRFGSNQHRQPFEPPEADLSLSPTVAPSPVKAQSINFTYEDHLLACLLREPDLLVWLAGAATTLEIEPLQVADLQNVESQEIFRTLKQFISSDEQWDIELFQELLTPQPHGWLAQLLIYGTHLPPRNEVDQREDVIRTLIRMRIQRLSTESSNIKFLEDDAILQGDLEGSKQWSDVKNRHLRELFHLQQTRQRAGQRLFSRRQPDHGMQI
jgi:DNA primase